MKHRTRAQAGFTIVEVLIVLAVTSAMLVSAITLINGKQNVAAFNQSIRNVQSEMQQVVNEVGSGYYPNSGNINCLDTGNMTVLFSTGVIPVQGGNSKCLFLGKMVQFGLNNGVADPEPYNVYTLAGIAGPFSNPNTTLWAAKARVIAQGSAPTESTVPNAFETKYLLYGLTVKNMYYDDNPTDTTKKTAVVGFVSRLNSLGNADGSQQVDVVVVPSGTPTFPHLTQKQAVDAINLRWSGGGDTSKVNPPGGVHICFASGGTNQSGLLSIGGAGRQGTVSLKIFGGTNCS